MSWAGWCAIVFVGPGLHARERAGGDRIKVLVDADACPVKEEILRATRRAGAALLFFIDTAHALRPDYGEVVTVATGHDSVDYALLSRVAPGDIVVTQDYGLAAMALARGGRAIHPSGLVYDATNIDALLAERHRSAKIRRGGGRTKGPRKRTDEDDARFAAAFAALLTDAIRDCNGGKG